MNRLNISQEATDQLETELVIALVRMIRQYRIHYDEPFWDEWERQEKLYYRSSRPHLTMPQALRDQAVRTIAAAELAQEVLSELLVLKLTPRQAVLTVVLVKLAFIHLTRTDAKVNADTSDIMDNACMSAGENAYDVLAKIGLINVDGFRFANWTEKGRKILRLLKEDIARQIRFDYRPETADVYGEKTRIRLLEAKMNLWLFK